MDESCTIQQTDTDFGSAFCCTANLGLAFDPKRYASVLLVDALSCASTALFADFGAPAPAKDSHIYFSSNALGPDWA